MLMGIFIALILAALSLIIMRLVGIFNKKISKRTDMTIAVLQGLEPNRKNFLVLPKKIWLLMRIWLKKRRLLVSILKRRALKRLKAQHEARQQKNLTEIK